MTQEAFDLPDAIKRAEQTAIKKRLETFRNALLHLFLPLDIDMQALGLLWEDWQKPEKDRRYNKDPVDYLKAILKDAHENHYKNKFKEAKDFINSITYAKLQTLLKDKKYIGNDDGSSILYGFLECLDNLKEKVESSDLFKDDVQEMLRYFKNNGYDSFHDWYCALAEYLRGKEACK
jgi:hypothetical protein